jgi:hypothetical protein
MSFKASTNESDYVKSKRIQALSAAVQALAHAVDTETNRGFYSDPINDVKNALINAVAALNKEIE